MTRINVVPVESLTDQHLRAELREITRIPNCVVDGKFKLDGDYPKEYTLGTGHVRFFIPRLGWLKKRHRLLVEEVTKRGFVANDYWPDNIPTRFMNDWTPTEHSIQINVERIKLRWPKNAKYCSMSVDFDKLYDSMLEVNQ